MISSLYSYTQPTKIDPLNVGGRIRKQVDEPVQPRMSIFLGKIIFYLIFKGIGETPLPNFRTQMSERPTMGGFGYNPTLGLVPQLSLPENLPELDNYATFDDNSAIDWTKQQMASIAPSFAISMLPDINDLSTTAPVVEPPKTTGKYFIIKIPIIFF